MKIAGRNWLAGVLRDARVTDRTARVASALSAVATGREFRPVVLGTLAIRAGVPRMTAKTSLRRLRELGYADVSPGAACLNVRLRSGDA